MKFENALLALKRGYKIYRPKDIDKYYFIKDGIIMHHKSYGIVRDGIQSSFTVIQIMAEDWKVLNDNHIS